MSIGLWQNPNFRKLWLGQSISAVGSQITFVALPLTAVLLLNASAAQMGILTAAVTLPYLLVGLPAGVWVDRLRRRSILITADVCRAALLATIPLAALLNLLRIEHLYLVAFSSGIFTVFYDVAEEAFLPSLIRRDQLVEGNSKMAAPPRPGRFRKTCQVLRLGDHRPRHWRRAGAVAHGTGCHRRGRAVVRRFGLSPSTSLSLDLLGPKSAGP